MVFEMQNAHFAQDQALFLYVIKKAQNFDQSNSAFYVTRNWTFKEEIIVATGFWIFDEKQWSNSAFQ